ncbi:NIF domain protein [Aspergillus sp. HF37]|nr:NIF domain protein [Aspergillus sp. HF37]
MTTHHTRNESLDSHEQNGGDHSAREMTGNSTATVPCNPNPPAGAAEDAVEIGLADFQRRAPPHNRRSSRRRSNVPDPGCRPDMEQMNGFDYGDQNPAPSFTYPAAPGPNTFDHPLQQPFIPQQPQFPGPPFGQDQFGSLNPSWDGFFAMSPATNTLPFMPPPFFFPNPVQQAPWGAFNGFRPFLPYPNAAGEFEGSLQNGVQAPPFDHGSRPRSKSPGRPTASEQYLTQASLPPKQLPTPQPLLVILDLNGTLIYRKSRKFPPAFTKRANLTPFLDTLLKKYKVMIWSSSQPHTVKAICQQLFPPDKRRALVVEWGRDMLGLSRSQYEAKTQVYKKLETVWASNAVQASYPRKQPDNNRNNSINAEAEHGNPPTKKKRRKRKNKEKKEQPQTGAHAQAEMQSLPLPPPGHRWDQTNTILLDDSNLKALSEPWNILEIPEFTLPPTPGVDEAAIFPDVLRRLAVLARHDDVSKVLRMAGENLEAFPWLPGEENGDGDEDGAEGEDKDGDQGEAQAKPPKKELLRLKKARRREREAEKKENKHSEVTQKRETGKKKRAARERAEREAAAGDAAAGGGGATVDNTPQRQPHASPGQQGKGEQEPLNRPSSSPSSPSSASRSENFLLDRLEESLGL